MMDKFTSRRNHVYLQDGVVYKQCQSQQAAAFEYNLLQRLESAGVPVPHVLSCENNTLCISYVQGELLLDAILREPDSIETEDLCKKMANWFALLYAACPGKSRGDVNCRNFIITRENIVGLDFEELPEGSPETDIGRLLAFILAYDPAYTPQRIVFAKALWQVFQLSEDTIQAAMQAEFEAMAQRRKGFSITLAEKAAQKVFEL